MSKKGVSNILLAIIFLFVLVVLSTNVSAYKLCSGVDFPEQSCPSAEKRIAQIDPSGCVKAFGCINPSMVSGGISKFKDCMGVDIPSYQKYCIDPKYSLTENLYRHTDLCRIGIVCVKPKDKAQIKCPPLLPVACDIINHESMVRITNDQGCPAYACQKPGGQWYFPFPRPQQNWANIAPGTSGTVPTQQIGPFLPQTASIPTGQPNWMNVAPGTSAKPPTQAPGAGIIYGNVGNTAPKPWEKPTPIGELMPQQPTSTMTPQPSPIAIQPIPQPAPEKPQVLVMTPSTSTAPEPKLVFIEETFQCGDQKCKTGKEECKVVKRECVKKKYTWWGKCTKYKDHYGCIAKPLPPKQVQEAIKGLKQISSPQQADYASSTEAGMPTIQLPDEIGVGGKQPTSDVVLIQK